MRRSLAIGLLFVLTLVGTMPGTFAQDAAKPAEGAKPAGGTHKVANGPLKVEVTLSGVLEATNMAEVSLVPKVWAQFVVREAVPAGKRVKKGDVLIQLETEKIDEAIRDLEAGQALAELAFKQDEQELRLLTASTPVDLETAQRAKKIADEDLERYEKIEAELAQKSEEFQVKSTKQYLEYAMEELKQLEKMYKADDLTEETEEIVLQRARNDVEQSQFNFERIMINHDRALKIDLPRAMEKHRDAARAAALAWDKAKTTLPLALSKAQLELEKSTFDRAKAAESLADMKHDRTLLTITAPADGIVYYGRCVSGKWTTGAELSGRLRRGGQLVAHEVLATVVQEGKLFVRANVPEKELAHVTTGAAGKLVPAAFPKTKVGVKVREVSSIPVADGVFEAKLDLVGAAPALIAGMAGEVKLVAYAKADAILVPSKALFADELDEDKQYVLIAGKDGKGTRRDVVAGQSSGTNTEITAGLKAGEQILLEKPAE